MNEIIKKKKRMRSSIDITKGTNVLFNIILIFIVFLCVFPLTYVFSISISSKASIMKYGYQIIPSGITFEAYKVILGSGSIVLTAFKNSLLLTVMGTLTGLFMITTYSYAVSRNDFANRKFFNMVAFIPMLFGGGMVANYIIMTQVLHLHDTFWALFFPLLMNTFNIVIMRTFFQTSVPFALIEAAKIDGASEYQIFFKIVLPISLPGIATIALFLSLSYWNDWYNAMLYLKQNSTHTTLQYLLMQIQRTIEMVLEQGNRMGSASKEALGQLPADGVRMATVIAATLPIALSYPFFQRYFIQGLTLGAVKE